MAGEAPTLAFEPLILGGAHTSLQLLQQLERDGCTGDGLRVVLRALGLASDLFACRFQGSGEPFLAHVIGTASVLSSLGAPSDRVAAGLLHDAYESGDFGDGRGGACAWKRDVVRRAVGDDVERHVYGFWRSLRWPPERIARRALEPGGADPGERAVLLLRIAALAAHHRDLGEVFGGRQQEARERIERLGPAWLRLARELGGPPLAAELERLFAATASARLPDALCHLTGRTGSFQLLPRGYRKRWSVALRSSAGAARDAGGRALARVRAARAGAPAQP